MEDTIFLHILDSLERNVSSVETRKQIYSEIMNELVEYDAALVDEMRCHDEVFDEAYQQFKQEDHEFPSEDEYED